MSDDDDTSVLRARGLRKDYGRDAALIRAVDGVDLDVAPGETVAVMGPSGCGKSTLLHLLGGLDRATAGEIWLAGRRLDQLPERALARLRRDAVGFVFQAFHLMDELTAAENVELPALLAGRSPRAARRRASALLERVGLADRAGFLPSALSGGQRQRVAIARALVADPQVVRQAQQLGGGMADVEHRDLELGMQPLEIGQDVLAGRGVERRQRLVHQQQPRAGQQRPGDRDPLPLAARQRLRGARQQRPQAQPFDRLLEAHPPLGRGGAPPAVFEVAPHRQVREQARLLENIAHPAAVGRHEPAALLVLPDLAGDLEQTGPGALEARHAAQQAGLAGRGGAEDAGHPGGRRREVDVEQEAAGARQLKAAPHLPPSPPPPGPGHFGSAARRASARRPPAPRELRA